MPPKKAVTMADKTYTYTGPLTGATLDDGREIMLHPGRDIPLPPDDPYVASLVGQGLLTEKPGAAMPAPAKEEI